MVNIKSGKEINNKLKEIYTLHWQILKPAPGHTYNYNIYLTFTLCYSFSLNRCSVSHVASNGSWICGVKETDGGLIPVSGQCTQTVSSSVPLTGNDEVAFRLTDQSTRWMGQCSVFG